jgi:Phage tail lysozyme
LEIVVADTEINVGIKTDSLENFQAVFNNISQDTVNLNQSFVNIEQTIMKISKSTGGIGAVESSMSRLVKNTNAWSKDVSKTVANLFSLGNLWKFSLGAMGLGGLGFGLDYLASDAAGRGRRASGLGTSVGAMTAFDTTMQRYYDPNQATAAAAQAKFDPQSQAFKALAGLGLNNPKELAKTSSEIAADVALEVSKRRMTTYEAHARGLQSFFGDQDIARLRVTNPNDIRSGIELAKEHQKQLDLDAQTTKAWQDMLVKISLAAGSFITKLETSMAGLTPYIDKFSDNIGAVADKLSNILGANIDTIGKNLVTSSQQISTGISTFVDIINSDKVQKFTAALNSFMDAVQSAGLALHNWIWKWFGDNSGPAKDIEGDRKDWWKFSGAKGSGADKPAASSSQPAPVEDKELIELLKKQQDLAIGGTGAMGLGDAGGAPGFAGRVGAPSTGRVSGGGGGAVGNLGVRGFWTAEKEKIAYDKLTAGGFTPDAAMAYISRWRFVESSGGPTSVNKSSGAYGIGQWLGNRKPGALASGGDFEKQLDYVIQESKTSESKLSGYLARAAKGDDEAAKAATAYERAEGYSPGSHTDNFTNTVRAGIAKVRGDLEGLKKPAATAPAVSKDDTKKKSEHVSMNDMSNFQMNHGVHVKVNNPTSANVQVQSAMLGSLKGSFA